MGTVPTRESDFGAICRIFLAQNLGNYVVVHPPKPTADCKLLQNYSPWLAQFPMTCPRRNFWKRPTLARVTGQNVTEGPVQILDNSHGFRPISLKPLWLAPQSRYQPNSKMIVGTPCQHSHQTCWLYVRTCVATLILHYLPVDQLFWRLEVYCKCVLWVASEYKLVLLFVSLW